MLDVIPSVEPMGVGSDATSPLIIGSDVCLPRAEIYASVAFDVELDAWAFGAVVIREHERVEIDGWSLFRGSRWAELRCVVEALSLLRDVSAVDVFTDFADLACVLQDGTYAAWRDSSFQGVKNADLWDRLGRLVEMRDTRFHLAQEGNADTVRAAELACLQLSLGLKAWGDLRARGWDPGLDPLDVEGEVWRSGIIKQAR